MKVQHKENRLSSYGRLGVLLAIIGVILGIDAVSNISIAYKLWPLLSITFGIGFIGIYARRDRNEAMYIGVGVYLIEFGGLALYCNLNTWSSLTTLWPLFIGFMGISILFSHFFGGRRPSTLLIGLLLISTAAVFFFVFELSPHYWWTSCILAGTSFLIFDKMRRS